MARNEKLEYFNSQELCQELTVCAAVLCVSSLEYVPGSDFYWSLSMDVELSKEHGVAKQTQSVSNLFMQDYNLFDS